MSDTTDNAQKVPQLEAVTVDPLSEPKKQWVKFDDESEKDVGVQVQEKVS